MSGKDPYRYFRIEARELLDQIGRGLLGLEGAPDLEAAAAAIAQLLRLAHTLKGAARVVRLPVIAEQAHAIEDILTPLRDQAAMPAPEQIEALLRLNDAILQALATLAGPVAAAAPVTPAASGGAPALALEALKPLPDELDGLLAALDQAHLQLNTLQQGLGLARQARGALRQPQGGAADAAALLARLERLLDGGLHRLGRELQGLREGAEQLRLLPAAPLFGALQRSCRDDALAQGKQVLFEAVGTEVRLEAGLLSGVQGALQQMLRNAIAHGIETPERRLAAGKPAQGRLRLTIERRGRLVLFACSDDGAGLDVPALRRAARDKGWPEADGDEPALIQRLLAGGLSTAARVDALAGRGVGMDVVRDTAARLGARLALRSEAGRGMTLELLAPLQLAALETLVVEAGGRAHHIPLDAVRRVVPAQELCEAGLLLDGELLPYAPLAGALAAEGGTAAPVASALVLEAGEARAVLGVERLAGSASVVLRPPPELLPDSPLVAGVVLDAAQQPRLVLDPAGLIAHAGAARRTPAAARASRGAAAPTVLVVDDSLTTRMLEQSILESAGYQVHLAVSAEQALEAARRQRYDLFLVDVEMPGMDGFGFIELTRADPQLRQVPAILLSSRNSPEDKRRGREVGASAYIVKSEFAQNEFLRQVHELVRAAA
ncbi:response regulator [Roseateles sp. DAIF2]|uniref:hybrid sensor histidine kinase/response regulator n=1 Tax=Roseateles sp. DAIF2 TaxID=2714952 RepID=UPI0018A27B64|nr:response regulator [Roseateles sp. DAIF2]QPF75484.1 response regulator [Roseateles sp. DAIF2]